MANSLHISDKNSKETVKRFESHEFVDEDGAEYGGSSFGGFGEYFRVCVYYFFALFEVLC